jgi:hypothetical protein
MTMKRLPDGSFRARRTVTGDSTLLDSQEAAVELEGRLSKTLKSESEVAQVLGRFHAGETIRVQGDRYIPHTADLEVIQPWDVELADSRAYLSIALLFLSLSLGESVYDQALDQIRRILQGAEQEEDAATWRLSLFQTPRESEMWHRVVLLEGLPATTIAITLFARWHYHVTFKTVRCRFPQKAGLFDASSERRIYCKENVESQESALELLDGGSAPSEHL